MERNDLIQDVCKTDIGINFTDGINKISVKNPYYSDEVYSGLIHTIWLNGKHMINSYSLVKKQYLPYNKTNQDYEDYGDALG